MSHSVHDAGPATSGKVIRWARLYNFFFGGRTARHKRVLDLAAIVPGERVLDVGCGPGTLALAAKERAGPDGEVYGIDAGAEMIEVARKKAAKAGSDVRFQTGLIEEIPFPDGYFDVVFSTFMLHHLPDDLKRRGFREIARVLKPGGRLLAADFAPDAPVGIFSLLTRVISHGLPKSYVADLVAMMKDAGLSAEVVRAEREPYAYIRAASPAPAAAR
jgi:demethylmenaquinone methyltransferase/2-methoxy-6-polyprenyl-1,4-benzoquinol methylase/phosphoethanolamine N-methyltransferase